MDNSDRWVEKYGESFMDFPLKGLKDGLDEKEQSYPLPFLRR